MKYLTITFLAVLIILAACSPVIDPRDPAAAAATQTAIAAQPVTGNVGVLRIALLNPPPIPTIAPAVVPTVDLPTVTPTPCRTIAGNINAQGRKLWHDSTSPQWNQIVIDESKGERWFCDVASAEAAGWTKAH